VAGLEIHPLSELRSEAAALLAERYARQRAAEPLLPDETDFLEHVPENGVAATRGCDLVAYLGGAVEDDMAYTRLAGVAASEPEAIRDLFGALSPTFGVSRFMVFVPASEPALVDAFFRLSFGRSATLAVQEAQALPAQPGVTVRESAPTDLRTIAELDQMLYAQLAESPSYSGLTVPSLEDCERDATDLWEENDNRYWSFIAESDGEPVGLAVMYRRPAGDLRIGDDTVDLAFAATTPAARGSGAGVALTHHVLTWAHERGFRAVSIDWRETNLPASRFWPKRGFRPTYVRLYRAVP